MLFFWHFDTMHLRLYNELWLFWFFIVNSTDRVQFIWSTMNYNKSKIYFFRSKICISYIICFLHIKEWYHKFSVRSKIMLVQSWILFPYYVLWWPCVLSDIEMMVKDMMSTLQNKYHTYDNFCVKNIKICGTILKKKRLYWRYSSDTLIQCI
jgi:hypothetical protein